MTIKASYPTIEPTLSLDFANSKRLDPRVTFTRNSVGTYFDAAGVLRTAAVNEPRFDHDPATGESLGLLVEEARTNLLVRSEEFDNVSWAKPNIDLTANQILAPNGSANADSAQGQAGTSLKYVYQSYVASTSGTYTFSVYLKAGSESFAVVRITDQTGVNEVRQRVDLSNGTLSGSVSVAGSTTSGSSTVTPAGNGWYRCTVTATFAAFTSLQGNIFINTYGATASTGNIYLWGAQLEAGAFPTSYIKTEGSTVTRQADSVLITGTNFSSWYRQSEGTFLLSWDRRNLGNWISYYSMFKAYSVAAPNDDFVGPVLTNGASNSVYWGMETANVSQLPYVQYTTTSLKNYISAMAYKVNDTAFAAGGTLLATDTDCITPTVDAGIFQPTGSTIRRLLYWNTRLPDATLQALTAS